MDKQTLIELIKIASPYVIAVLGILSPLFTTKYLNKEDFRKYKKQRNYDKNIEIYSILITELREFKRISEYIVKMAEYYEHKDEPEEFKNIFHEKDNDENRLKDVAKYTVMYDDILRESQNKIRKILHKNFVFLQDDIFQKISYVTEEYDSPLHIFDWGIPVMDMRKGNFKINLENIKRVYIDSRQMYKDLVFNTDNVIKELKKEITGEK